MNCGHDYTINGRCVFGLFQNDMKYCFNFFIRVEPDKRLIYYKNDYVLKYCIMSITGLNDQCFIVGFIITFVFNIFK